MFTPLAEKGFLEKDFLVGSGSDLLDSFYVPLQTTTCLQNKPVVDVEAVLATLSYARAGRPLAEPYKTSNKTSRGQAVHRLKHTLKQDRYQCS